jgi:hypothetical protein
LRLRTRLFLLVLLASALPAALVLTVGWLQLRRQLSLWTLPSVESALEVSVQTNRRAVDRLMRQLETEGRILAESSLFPPAPADTTGLTELLDSGCREFGLDLAQFYVAEDGGFRLLVSRTSSGSGGPDGSAWLLPPLGSVAGPERPRPVRLRGSREDHLAIPTFLWEEAPADSARLRGALLRGVAMGAGFHDQVMEVSTGLHLYRRLREMGMLLQTGFGLLAAIVLALSFAVSYWAAQRVAGSVSRPIDSLIRDMDAVGRSGDAAAGRPDATPGDGAAPGSGPPRAVGGDGAAGGSGPEPGQDRAIGGQRRGTAERRSPIPEMARLTEAFRSMRRTLQA